MVYVATVIGRNRRVYSRVYKRNSDHITRMAEHYRQMEAEKSAREGFRVTGMTELEPHESNGVCTRVFKIEYAEGNRYVNRTTGETTGDRVLAACWYRDGSQVEIWRDGKMILGLLM